MRALVLPLAVWLVAALPAHATPGCRAVVNGTEVVIAPDAVPGTGSPGFREGLVTLPRRTWDWAWGAPAPCDSVTLIAFMAGVEGIPERQIGLYCLAPLPEDGAYLLVPGARNFRGRCARTVCDRINLAAADALIVSRRLAEVVTGDKIEGLSGFAQTTGTYLLTGDGGVLRPVLEGLASGLGAALTASPTAAVGVAATVLAAGGAVYVCRD